jgi:hypothetical protein
MRHLTTSQRAALGPEVEPMSRILLAVAILVLLALCAGALAFVCSGGMGWRGVHG